jgi:diaminopimelate epimerase
MDLDFQKYHGAGNDFILIDDRAGRVLPRLTTDRVAGVCHRHFGVGADGLMLLRPGEEGIDFEMIYYNADGSTSTLCGNGARCILRFAHDLGIHRDTYTFRAADGIHTGRIAGDQICLSMHDIATYERDGAAYLLNTGSPHYVVFRNDLDEVDVLREGRAVRYAERYRERGVNVNFAAETERGIDLLTYERGVEAETLACGTGVTAAAIAYRLAHDPGGRGPFRVDVRARGGDLFVRGVRTRSGFGQLELWGPAERVFGGRLTLEDAPTRLPERPVR